ncbi:hypothetical protein FB565_003304 [Actinoplanes lutulentus]|uniref:Uncharacterized protein n=1 Tax=Actinoplanes lutulentus TaxID=1287878 RepID=A0A327Z069_9ACTN|nr:hypothetical protein [Actinoplanes lutulentus]MBB2943575.1 hypothetical protein [Actinoplanes lutulentus]RAK27441.1 hypothetical protein B0I29_12375 [Actinoplanes lutulentus]
MSAFNVVTVPADEKCPNCGNKIRRRVQFKYGARRAFEYEVGDTLRWGVNDEGVPAHLVRVMGYPELCSACGDEPEWLYDIAIRDNVIESVTQSSSDLWAGVNEAYLIVEP